MASNEGFPIEERLDASRKSAVIGRGGIMTVNRESAPRPSLSDEEKLERIVRMAPPGILPGDLEVLTLMVTEESPEVMIDGLEVTTEYDDLWTRVVPVVNLDVEGRV